MNKPITALLAFVLPLLPLGADAQQMLVEYWTDSDPGIGRATRIAVSPSADGSAAFAIPSASLSVGDHLLGFRALTVSDGKTHYGPTVTQNFHVPYDQDEAGVQRVEYFWDEDPGFGLATPIAIDSHSADMLITPAISTDGLTQGKHVLGIRVCGNMGWGPTILQEVSVPRSVEEAKIHLVEYFWDEDPGFGLGTPFAIASAETYIDLSASVPTDGLAPGEHILFVRAHGNMGWGPTVQQQVFVPHSKEIAVIDRAEYFWNDDPGFGLATPLTVPGGFPAGAKEIELNDIAIPSFSVHGDATLFLRFHGPEGWSPTISYTVMVDAEGNYTLNAQAETSMENRNYQTLPDALTDFEQRGVGDDITLTVPTKNTDYTLAVATDSAVQSLQAITAQMLSSSTARHQKTIAFTAKEATGNSITVTASDGSPVATAIAFFAQTRQENVALTINGTPYDFTPASQRMDEVCSGEETLPVALSQISTAITASWQARPHQGTVLSGFPTEGTGDLPVMAITNSGTAIDSLAYEVTLADEQGNSLYSYTYYIFVHARVSTQRFASLTPADGSSLDPGKVTLRWSPIGDAVGGYRVTVLDGLPVETTESTEPAGTPAALRAPAAALDGSPVETVITTTATSLELPVVSGHRYTWTVTAIGYCDELESPAMTFGVRLLPDLAVTAITLPEAAQAGNTLTIQATVTNQGEGATTETTWTDRLYYVIDSSDFGKAVQAAEVKHTGNIAAGASYETTLTMTVPYVEAGTLRVFVETDATAKVMESDDANNRTLSSTSATLAPFYMNQADLAALRQLYSQFDGTQWNGTQWDITSELIKTSNWSGVTFDSEGRVTAINLQGRGLTGSLSTATPLTLPQLRSLNMSRNAISGDPALFITADGLPALTSLDLSYNQIDELSAPLPATITTLSLAAQHRRYGANATFPGIDALTAQVLLIGKAMTVTLPPVVAYDHKAQAFTQHPQMDVWTPDMKTRHGRLAWDNIYECYRYTANSWQQRATQDEEAILAVTDGYSQTSTAMPSTIYLTTGDANMTGWVDVNDVQRTLNYVLDYNNTTTFCFWAANTYTAEESSLLINIQDIVCTVNIVLENQGGIAASRRHYMPAPSAAATATLYTSGQQLMLDASEPVAALCVELRGVNSRQMKLLLDRHDWQMQTRNTDEGVCLLIFSPTGAELPVVSGQQLLRLAATAEAVSAEASSPEAMSVTVAIGDGEATGIRDIFADGDDEPMYDLQGRRVDNAHKQCHGIYIRNNKKQVK